MATLTQADRRALQKIVKDRFKSMRAGINDRAEIAKRDAKKLIESEARAAATELNTRVKKLQARAAKLDEEIGDIRDEAKAQGFVLLSDGYETSKYGIGAKDQVRRMEVRPRKTGELINSHAYEIELERLRAQESLASKEQKLIEGLILGEGDDATNAREWLDKNVPTLENLIALPEPEAIRAQLTS